MVTLYNLRIKMERWGKIIGEEKQKSGRCSEKKMRLGFRPVSQSRTESKAHYASYERTHIVS